VEALIADERAKQHNVLADRLSAELNTNGTVKRPQTLNGDASLLNLLFEITPRTTLEDLILPEAVVRQCREVVEEHQRADLLRSHGLEPRHRLLFTGPPGNGKTSLAEAVAHALMVPLVHVRYEGVIGSYLGETASRLRRIFDQVRTQHCVLFFDEFDTLGKERGDPQDTGEIKRVVSSLLLQIDALPSYVVVVTATNHAELLDRAVWRRFQLKVELPKPGAAERTLWFSRFQARLSAPFEQTPAQLARALDGASFSELRDIGEDIIRRWVLSSPSGEMAKIVLERIRQWKEQPRPMAT
jgi:SpoVK/Ycf46/Vps4 family AAA+-type ATPase